MSSASNALLIDLDGVIYQGEQAVAGAVDAISWLQQTEVPHLYVTNTTSRPRKAIVTKLAAMGAFIAEERIFTPPVAASTWLRQLGIRRVALFVPKATREDFADFDMLPDHAESGAQAVIVGDLGEAWDFQTMNRAFRLLMQQPSPHLIALGMTRYWRAEDGLRLDTAPFVTALAHASGVEPRVLGKPAQAFFAAAATLLGTTAEQTWMLGDDIRADVSGAQAAGLKGILVRTGKFRDQDLDSEVEPDAVLDSFADLPDWWESAAD